VTNNNKIQIIWSRRVRKQKVWPVFKDRQGIGIDSKNDIYKQASPGFSV
jgi:hypothetical protein